MGRVNYDQTLYLYYIKVSHVLTKNHGRFVLSKILLGEWITVYLLEEYISHCALESQNLWVVSMGKGIIDDLQTVVQLPTIVSSSCEWEFKDLAIAHSHKASSKRKESQSSFFQCPYVGLQQKT